jgi:hypothetical protein
LAGNKLFFVRNAKLGANDPINTGNAQKNVSFVEEVLSKLTQSSIRITDYNLAKSLQLLVTELRRGLQEPNSRLNGIVPTLTQDKLGDKTQGNAEISCNLFLRNASSGIGINNFLPQINGVGLHDASNAKVALNTHHTLQAPEVL